jgi:hypothetical protein
MGLLARLLGWLRRRPQQPVLGERDAYERCHGRRVAEIRIHWSSFASRLSRRRARVGTTVRSKTEPQASPTPSRRLAARLYEIRRTILPNCSPASRRSCAARASLSGRTESTTGFARPLLTSSYAASKSLRVPMVEP